MASKTANVNSISSFTEGESITILGKNGFSSTIGSIPVLCTAVSYNTSDIGLTLKGLQHITDLNHEEHILAVNDGQIFLSIGSEEPTVQALHARPDLTRFYLVGDTNDTVFQYYLDVPGDISTGRVLKNPFSVSNKETQPRGITFSTTGAYMYVIGSASDSIHQYRLSNPWELATAKFLATKSIQSQTTDPRGIFFKYDGTYCYVVDTATVFQYKLTNPWDITSAALENSKTITTFSGTGASAVDYVKSIYISPAGDYFFLTNGGAANKTNAIYKYTMSESWNVISGSYSTQSLNINSRENNPGGLVFKGDGSKLYVSGAQGDDVTEFSLSTPWDLTSATYVTDSLNNTNETGTTGMYISSDGTQVYLTGTTLDTVNQYRLSTPWDTSTGSFANANLNILSLTGEGQSKGLFIPENGGNVYVTGSLNDRIYQIKLGDPFNFSNITSITNYDISSRETNPQGIFFKPDGTKMFVAGQTNATSIAGNTIYEYSLSKPWNVETSTFSGFYNITQGVNPGITDFFIREDGERLYVTGTTDNKIYPYRLNTPWSIASSEWLTNQIAVDTLLGETDPTGIYLSKGGTRCYIAGTSADKIFQTQLSDKWDITTLKYATSSFGGVRGEDYVSIPLTVTNDKILGQVGYVNLLEETSIKIKEYNLSDSSSNIVISEGTSNSSGLVATSIPSERLSSKLPTVPFLVKLPQHITSRYFDARSLYVEGTRKKVQKTFDVTGIQGVYSANLALIPLGQSFIKAYLDNIDITNTITWNGEYSISLPISTEHVELKTIVDYYTVPAIEANDYVVIYDDFKFKVSNVSYLHTDPEYNTYLTSNSVYRIKLDKSIDSRIRTGNQIINITDDLIGTVGNLNSTVNTISIDYDEEKYPYTYNLSNHKIYTVTTGSNKFNRINLGPDRTIKDVKPGYYTFRAKNITSLNRQSPISSASIYLRPIPIGKVDDLTLTESYFIDTGQAAVTRITVSFTHLADQNVTDYEISFKIAGSASDLTTFNTVKVSAAGVESDGKIRYVINNVDRGPTSAGYTLVVRVTPLNGDKRGVTAEKSQAIIGKLAQPKTVLLFNARQFQDSIFFSYKVPTVRDQTGSGSEVNPYDIDLNYIDIRRIPGSCTAPTSTNWSTDATEIIRAPTPSTGAQAPVTTIGTYTYLAKTVDTSGNESADIAYATLTTIESPDIAVANTYDEANPSGNNITSVDNSNYREYYWPSFSNSTNGGLSVPGAGSADNANGTSSGWSQGADIDLTTIFTTGATANYQTKVRTLESVRTGSVKINYDYSTIFTGDYNSLRSNILNGTSCTSTSSNVFKSTGIGNYLIDAIYDSANKTLSNGGSSGNVFAIWNTNTDVGNSNSYALIAGRIDSDTLALGNTFFANGSPTYSNAFPNLTTAYKGAFSLVNLQQYSDDPSLTYQGSPDAVSTRLYYRYSDDASAFHANSNLILENFSSFTELSGGVIPQLTFKHLQLRLDFKNTSPSTTAAQLTDFNYYLQLTKIPYVDTITLDTNPKTIDYSSKNFSVVPEITAIVPINVGYAVAPEVTSISTTQATIKVYKISDSSLPTGIQVTVKAEGA